MSFPTGDPRKLTVRRCGNTTTSPRLGPNALTFEANVLVASVFAQDISFCGDLTRSVIYCCLRDKVAARAVRRCHVARKCHVGRRSVINAANRGARKRHLLGAVSPAKKKAPRAGCLNWTTEAARRARGPRDRSPPALPAARDQDPSTMCKVTRRLASRPSLVELSPIGSALP